MAHSAHTTNRKQELAPPRQKGISYDMDTMVIGGLEKETIEQIKGVVARGEWSERIRELSEIGSLQFATAIIHAGPEAVPPQWWSKIAQDFENTAAKFQDDRSTNELSLKLKSKELTKDEIEQILTTGRIKPAEPIDVDHQEKDTEKSEDATRKDEVAPASISKDPSSPTIQPDPDEHPIIDC